MLYNKITNTEIEAIRHRIEISVDNVYNHHRCTDMKHILRVWNANKQPLMRLLDDNLILEKPVLFSKSVDELAEELDAKMPEHLREAIQKIVSFYYNLYDYTTFTCTNDLMYNSRWDIEVLLSNYTLAANKCNINTKDIVLPNNESIRIQKGCKPMKIIKKLFAAMGYEDSVYEDLRLFQSQVLNQKQLRGTLCLSIHPLDFMTMSDNNEDWSSCMSWDDNGCYRIGTVEMMNSPYVVVAYLKSDSHTYRIGNLEWNSKKWRCLYIIDANRVITSIKGYPYYNESLLEAAGEWLVELANKNSFGDFDATTANIYDYNKIADGVRVDFSTYGMYNDFGCANHWGVVAKNFADDWICLNYSGESECMWCGDLFKVESDEEGTLVCPDCSGAIRCDECGCHIDPEYSYSDPNGDGSFCESCYSDLFITDSLTNTPCYREDIKPVYIIPNDSIAQALITEQDYNWYKYYTINIKNKEEYDEETWTTFFKSTAVEIKEVEKVSPWGKDTYYYVLSEDLSDRGFSYFIGYNIDKTLYETTGRLQNKKINFE